MSYNDPNGAIILYKNYIKLIICCFDKKNVYEIIGVLKKYNFVENDFIWSLVKINYFF